jgi:soluble lytic murein transglycosylase
MRQPSSAEERAFYVRFGHLLTTADHLARLERLIGDRKRSAALRLAKGLGEDHYALTLARLKLKLMEPGVDAAIARVPTHLRSSPELVFERARWRQRKNRFSDALALIESPAAASIDPARWWPMRNWAAREALLRGQPELAYRLTSQHGVASGLGFAEGEFLAGWIALRRLDRADRAQPHFQRLHDGVTSPISRARGAFWAGEAAQRLQKVDEAAAWYRRAASHDLTFYGQLAARRLGEEPHARQAPPPLAGLLPEAFAADELVRTTELLSELGQDQLVARMFGALRSRTMTAEELLPVADFALILGRPDQAVRTAKKERQMGGEPEVAHLFPRPPLALAENDRTALVLALIRQESQFDAKAISPAGARGLMQLMPATAKYVAKKQNLRYRRASLTEDPAYNVRLGQFYLAAMLERFDDYVPLALAAYNAGPHRADRWLKLYGDPRTPDVDALDWIEQIPFSETRNYVQRVMEGYAVYARMQATTIDPLAALLGPPQTVRRTLPEGESLRPN